MLYTQSHAFAMHTRLKAILEHIDATQQYESSRNIVNQLLHIADCAVRSLASDIRENACLVFFAIFSINLDQELQNTILINSPVDEADFATISQYLNPTMEHSEFANLSSHDAEVVEEYKTLFANKPNVLDTEVHTTAMLDILNPLYDNIITRIENVLASPENHIEDLENFSSIQDNRDTLDRLIRFASHAHEGDAADVRYQNASTIFLALFYNELNPELQQTILAGLSSLEAGIEG